MTLRDYLEDTGLKQKWVAKQLGINITIMSAIVKGHRIPTPALAEKIRLVTNGKVLFDETPVPPRIGVLSPSEERAMKEVG